MNLKSIQQNNYFLILRPKEVPHHLHKLLNMMFVIHIAESTVDKHMWLVGRSFPLALQQLHLDVVASLFILGAVFCQEVILLELVAAPAITVSYLHTIINIGYTHSLKWT